MPVTINGNGSITGLSVGGLGSGVVNDTTLASNAVTNAKIASGAITSSSLPSGTVVQAKHLQFTTDLSGTAGSITDLTGFNLSITPTSASNDIIIILHATMGLNCDGRVGLKRNGTQIVEHLIGSERSPYIEHDVGTFCGTYKDSPNSTSAVTYQVTVRVTGCGQNYHINESTSGSTDNGRSGMTLLEIAG